MALWADLPADQLNVILSKLFGKDRHSFNLVCRHWKSVAKSSPYCYSPCLMNYRPHIGTWEFYQCNSFSNPELKNAEILCSRYGWLLMSRNNDSLLFFDPSNNRKLELPHIEGIGCTSLWFLNPTTSPECAVVWILENNTDQYLRMRILKHGDDEWDYMEYPNEETEEGFWMSVGPAVLHGGLIYFLNVEGDVATLDMEQGRLDFSHNCLTRESGIVIEKQYLVKVNGEDCLFAVFVFESRKVNVYRLSSSDVKWELVETLGDKVRHLSGI